MDSIETARWQRRARLRYEWARLRRALLGFAPALLVVALAVFITPRPASALLFGGALFFAGVTLLWYGRDLHRAVLPGVLAGGVPLAVALCANHIGHVCAGGSCMSLCLPACAGGGLIASIVVSVIGHRRKLGSGFWIAGSVVALLTGAMGCACIGYSGLFGLLAGYGLGLLAVLRPKS
jgi:hypothetical protein